MSQVLAITRKELKTAFGSPMAAIFIGAFLLATLFAFFWVETFFARNTADVRPLFTWMPILLVFLTAALTMRQWSEEQKMGTLEILLTLPVPLPALVLGKFLAVLCLVAVSLALTAGLPVTVAFMGELDWGPVAGGYLGALLVAASYTAIGLFISSRTDNQIIALILTVLVAGLFYLVGSSGVVGFAGTSTAELLRLLGTGSRFASIERGVVDLRDLVYYGSLCLGFLALNTLSLDRSRWSGGPRTRSYRVNAVLAVILALANLALLNLWLTRVPSLRIDLTAGREYSISSTTRDLLANLREPLTLTGYFSERTHPLLAPLVPRIRDLLAEYRLAGEGKVAVSFVDPKEDEELEAEANQMYGIRPVPFQIAGRYEASVVNSYFHLLVKYGDQYATLGFDDLIEVQRHKDGQLDVRLRNLEYDLTKSIKKVVYGFQSLAAVFADVGQPMTLTAYVTRASLPPELGEVPGRIDKVAAEIEKESGGKFQYRMLDPDEPGAGVSRQQLTEGQGLRPFSLGLFSEESFYLHLVLQVGDKSERVYLGGEMAEADIRKDLEAALKRSSSGFLKTVGLWTPKPSAPPYGGQPPQGPTFQALTEALRSNYNLLPVDLADGRVPGEVDVLLLVAPQAMTDAMRFGVDQYLMRGGAVVTLAGHYALDLQPYANRLGVKKIEGGLAELLAAYGIKVEDGLVMDLQNEPFPVPVSRNLGGGFVVQEIMQVNYPYFVDVRSSGMNRESPVVANLPAVTLNWASPLAVDAAASGGKAFTTLLQSSPQSWVTTSTDVQPDFSRYPDQGFATGETMAPSVLALAMPGPFTSYFADKPAPVLAADKPDPGPELGPDGQALPPKEPEADKTPEPPPPLVKRSPDSARLVVVGSAEFVNDTVIRITQSLGQDRFLSGLELVQNAIDWAVEDEDLLAIRSRGTHARLLAPMSRKEQSVWEGINYGIAIVALVAVSIAGAVSRRRETAMAIELGE
ncbi:MAG: Gldg family protein [Thermodesulfobacteriota bacterium]